MIEAVKEAIEDQNNKFKQLARLLLDDDGISAEAYQALLEVMPTHLSIELNKWVEETNGRFYLEGHPLYW